MHVGPPDYPGNSAHTALTGWQTSRPEYVMDPSPPCLHMCAHVSPCPATESSPCKKRREREKKRQSANYNIKVVSTNDLSAFAPCAITLNQERSAADVAPMHKLLILTNVPPPPPAPPLVSLFSPNAAGVQLLNDFNNSAAPPVLQSKWFNQIRSMHFSDLVPPGHLVPS